jgi:hypothetical protein
MVNDKGKKMKIRRKRDGHADQRVFPETHFPEFPPFMAKCLWHPFFPFPYGKGHYLNIRL